MKTEKLRRIYGFTLIELLVVVTILGILAATIIPQFIGTTTEARIGAAKTHVTALQTAIDHFNIHMDRYPTTEEGLKVLVDPPSSDENKKWRGPYIDTLRNDPWGHPYQYRFPGTHSRARFDVWSRGPDNVDGGEGDNADIGNW